MSKARIYIPLVMKHWPSIQVSNVQQKEQCVAMPINCLIRLDGAIFFMPCYLSLGLLRQDFPEAEIMELEVEIPLATPGKKVSYSVCSGTDGQLVTEVTEDDLKTEPPQGG